MSKASSRATKMLTMTKAKLLEKIRHYIDDAPRGYLERSTVAELDKYLTALRETYPNDVSTEPE